MRSPRGQIMGKGQIKTTHSLAHTETAVCDVHCVCICVREKNTCGWNGARTLYRRINWINDRKNIWPIFYSAPRLHTNAAAAAGRDAEVQLSWLCQKQRGNGADFAALIQYYVAWAVRCSLRTVLCVCLPPVNSQPLAPAAVLLFHLI